MKEMIISSNILKLFPKGLNFSFWTIFEWFRIKNRVGMGIENGYKESQQGGILFFNESEEISEKTTTGLFYFSTKQIDRRNWIQFSSFGVALKWYDCSLKSLLFRSRIECPVPLLSTLDILLSNPHSIY